MVEAKARNIVEALAPQTCMAMHTFALHVMTRQISDSNYEPYLHRAHHHDAIFEMDHEL